MGLRFFYVTIAMFRKTPQNKRYKTVCADFGSGIVITISRIKISHLGSIGPKPSFTQAPTSVRFKPCQYLLVIVLQNLNNMNTKHFLIATILLIGFTMSSFHADAHRGRRHHRHARQAPICLPAPPLALAPRVILNPFSPARRMARRAVVCAPMAYCHPAPRHRHIRRAWR